MGDFLILESEKVGLDSPEGYVVVREGVSFLRVLGADPSWKLMTATASEDHGRIRVCSDQRRLVEAAFRFCLEQGVRPEIHIDRNGREYVKMGTITAEPSESDEEFQTWSDALFRRFFEIFDSYKDPGSRSVDEMQELYEALATDEEGSDVYLSDGVWLTSDGSLRDTGR